MEQVDHFVPELPENGPTLIMRTFEVGDQSRDDSFDDVQRRLVLAGWMRLGDFVDEAGDSIAEFGMVDQGAGLVASQLRKDKGSSRLVMILLVCN